MEFLEIPRRGAYCLNDFKRYVPPLKKKIPLELHMIINVLFLQTQKHMHSMLRSIKTFSKYNKFTKN